MQKFDPDQGWVHAKRSFFLKSASAQESFNLASLREFVADLEQKKVQLEAEASMVQAKVLENDVLLKSAREFLRILMGEPPVTSVAGASDGETGTYAKGEAVSHPKKQTKKPVTASGKPRKDAKSLILQLASEILLEVGRPLERQDILKGIVARGHQLAVSDPAKTIGKTLWADPRFQHVEKRGYWLAGVDVPPGDAAE